MKAKNKRDMIFNTKYKILKKDTKIEKTKNLIYLTTRNEKFEQESSDAWKNSNLSTDIV